MMFKNNTIARLMPSKFKRCKCCGINLEKIQGYCEECLKLSEPEIELIKETHLNESKGNSMLGRIFFVITALILCIIVFHQ